MVLENVIVSTLGHRNGGSLGGASSDSTPVANARVSQTQGLLLALSPTQQKDNLVARMLHERVKGGCHIGVRNCLRVGTLGL